MKEKISKMMQRLKSFKFPKVPYSALNTLAICMCVYLAGTRCGWLLHEPKMPAEIKKFRQL